MKSRNRVSIITLVSQPRFLDKPGLDHHKTAIPSPDLRDRLLKKRVDKSGIEQILPKIVNAGLTMASNALDLPIHYLN